MFRFDTVVGNPLSGDCTSGLKYVTDMVFCSFSPSVGYFVDNTCNTVGVFDPAASTVTHTSLGWTPVKLVCDEARKVLYVSQFFQGAGSRIYKLDPLNNFAATVLAGNGSEFIADGTGTSASFAAAFALYYNSTSDILWIGDRSTIRHLDLNTLSVKTVFGHTDLGNTDGIGTAARFMSVRSFDLVGNVMYIADTLTVGQRIRRIDLATYNVTTVAGANDAYVDGLGLNARFQGISGMVYAPSRKGLFVTDSGSVRLRFVDLNPGPSFGMVSTIAGNGSRVIVDGTMDVASFRMPLDVVLVPNNNTAWYVLDSRTIRIMAKVGA